MFKLLNLQHIVAHLRYLAEFFNETTLLRLILQVKDRNPYTWMSAQSDFVHGTFKEGLGVHGVFQEIEADS